MPPWKRSSWRSARAPTFCRRQTRIVTQHITRASRLVSAITGFAVQPNKAIVGANAFAHEAGIHQDGMLKHAGTYEIMRPEDVGLVRSNLVMGKHSGRHAFKKKLAELGYEIGDNALAEAFARFKALADKKKEIFDEDLIALVDDEIQAIDQQIKVVGLEVHCGSQAEVVRPHRARDRRRASSAPRPRATARSMPPSTRSRSWCRTTATLALFQIHAVTEGTDAQAEVTVRLEEHGKTVNGQAAETDTILASARAYVTALNKLLVKREKTAPAALSA